MNRRPLALAVSLGALALPATAVAHPGVYTNQPKVAAAGCNYTTSPSGACLTDGAVRYAIANDGWAADFTEAASSNWNQTDGSKAGMINYRSMPGTYRNAAGEEMTSEEKRTFGPAQTDVQAHATCADPDLGPAEILAWQEADPFFNYVPWQKTSAGLGDEPEHWIAVVKDATGVDLATVTDFAAACAGIGGTYHPADTRASITNALEASVKQPLQAQIDLLTGQAADLNARLNAALAKPPVTTTVTVTTPGPATPAPVPSRPLTLTLAGKAFRGGQVIAQVTGAPNAGAKLAVTVAEADRRKLGFKTRTVVSQTRPLGAAGARLFVLTVSKSAAGALRRAGKATPVTITATVGSATETAKATLR